MDEPVSLDVSVEELHTASLGDDLDGVRLAAAVVSVGHDEAVDVVHEETVVGHVEGAAAGLAEATSVADVDAHSAVDATVVVWLGVSDCTEHGVGHGETSLSKSSQSMKRCGAWCRLSEPWREGEGRGGVYSPSKKLA